MSAMAARKKNCILVIGMHRSGTSAVTRSISLLGATLPSKIMGAGEGNVVGHWEPVQIQEINDAMLAEAGSRWDDWRQFDPGVLTLERREYYEDEIARILAEDFGDAPVIILKEPRISRFAALYLRILDTMDYNVFCLHMVRNPLAVSASLHARDGMSKAQGDLLWLRHELDAEYATRGRCRAFLSYEELMRDWRSAIGRIVSAAGSAGIPLASENEDIGTFLHPEHTHFTTDDAELRGSDERLQFLAAAYDAFVVLEEDEADDAARGRLDSLRTRFDSLSKIAGTAMYDSLRLEAQRHAQDLFSAQQLHSEARGECDWLKSELAKATTTMEAVRGECDWLQSELAKATTTMEATRDECDWLQSELAKAITTLEVARSQAAHAEQDVIRLTAEIAEDHETQAQLVMRNAELARRVTRLLRRPFVALRDNLRYRVALALARFIQPFSSRSAEKFRSSAAKRDPKRYM